MQALSYQREARHASVFHLVQFRPRLCRNIQLLLSFGNAVCVYVAFRVTRNCPRMKTAETAAELQHTTSFLARRVLVTRDR